jgi:hypothetical protein
MRFPTFSWWCFIVPLSLFLTQAHSAPAADLLYPVFGPDPQGVIIIDRAGSD